jgi:hypothetical protein
VAFNYARIAANAAILLQKFGAQITLRQTAAGVYDNATGTVTPPTPTDQPRFAALFDFGPGTTNVRGNLVQMTDKRVYMEPGIVPTLNDSLIAADGVKYSIVSIGELKPATTAVLYDLHVRAA